MRYPYVSHFNQFNSSSTIDKELFPTKSRQKKKQNKTKKNIHLARRKKQSIRIVSKL